MSDEPTPDAPPEAAPAILEALVGPSQAPPPRSIGRDVALVAVVFVAVFILLGGILSLAARSGEHGVTSAPSTSSVPAVADSTTVPTPSALGAGSRSATGSPIGGSITPAS